MYNFGRVVKHACCTMHHVVGRSVKNEISRIGTKKPTPIRFARIIALSEKHAYLTASGREYNAIVNKQKCMKNVQPRFLSRSLVSS